MASDQLYKTNKAKTFRYMRNVGRSFGYSFNKSIREANPVISAMFNQAKEQTTNLYHGIKDFSSNIKNFDSNSNSIVKDVKDTVDYGFKNLIADLKSGNWYNTEREESVAGAMLGFDDDMMNFDVDDDFNFDDFNFDDDETEKEVSANARVQAKATKKTVEAMDAVGSKTSAAIGAATVNSANYIAKVSRANTNALFKLNTQGFSTVSTGIAAVNTNISTLVELGKPLTEHMQNSSLFFTKSTEFQEKTIKLLEQIVANTSSKSANDKSTHNRNRSLTLSDLYSSDGTLNIDAIKKIIKNRASNSEIGMGLDMLSAFGSPKDMMKALAANPLGMVLDWMTGRMLDSKGRIHKDKTLRGAMGSFNDTLSGLLPNLLAKFKSTDFSKNEKLPGWLKNLLSEVKFSLPSSGLKQKMNPGNYEKGKVDWDGISRKALTEVIPEQLSKILAAITGEQEQRFDYNTGKWIPVSKLQKQYQNRLEQNANRAVGGLFSDTRNMIKKSSLSKKDKRSYDAQVQAFINQLFLNDDEDFYKFINGNEDFNYKKYKNQISEVTLKDFRKRVQAMAKQDPKYLNTYAKNMYATRASYGRELADTDGVMMSLHNRSNRFGKTNIGTNILLNTVDEVGRNIFDYLRGMYIDLGFIKDNFVHLIPNATPPGTPPGGNNGESRTINLTPERILTSANSHISRNAPTGYNTKPEALQINQSAEDMAASRNQNSNSNKYDPDKWYSKEQQKYMKKKERAQQQGLEFDIDEDMEEKIRLIKANIEKMKSRDQKRSERIDKLGENKVIKNFMDLSGVTTDAFVNMMEGASNKINDFIYGTGIDKDKSFASIMSDSVSGIFGQFTKTISSLFPGFVRTWLKNLNEALGITDKLKSMTKNAFQGIVDWFTGVNSSIMPRDQEEDDEEDEEVTDQTTVNEEDIDTTGGAGSGIRKFYRKANAVFNSNKAQNMRGWNKTSAYNKNNIVSINSIGAGRSTRTKSRNRSRRFGIGGGKTNTGSDDAAAAGDAANNIVNDDNLSGDIKEGIIKRVANFIINKIEGNVNGEQDTEDQKNKVNQDRKRVANTVDKLFRDATNNKNAIGAGALMGAGVSLLTGVALGPIAGAAIGAGIGFISKSETAQNFLFGEDVIETDKETGERKTVHKEGKLEKISPKLSKFLQNQAPEVFKAGTVGTIIGTFTGSPVLGAILGSSIGFVKSSDKAKNILFGELDENGERKGGIISKKLQDLIKSKIPAMGIGGAIGLLSGGPFGILGNVLVGSALGFAADSEKFKDWLFGEKVNGKRKLGVGGFSEYIKKTLFNPIVDIFKNLGSAISTTIKDAVNNFNHKIRDFFIKKLFLPLLGKGPFRWLFNRAKGLGKKVYNVATSPIRGVSNAIRMSNIKHGRKAYKDGKLMSATEMAEATQNRILFNHSLQGRFQNDVLAGIEKNNEGNLDAQLGELGKIKDVVSYAMDPTKAVEKEITDHKLVIRDAFNNYIKQNNMTDKEAKDVRKAFNKIGSGYIDDYQIANISSIMNPIYAKYPNGAKEVEDTIKKARTLTEQMIDLRNMSEEQAREHVVGKIEAANADGEGNSTISGISKWLLGANKKLDFKKLSKLKNSIEAQETRINEEKKSKEKEKEENPSKAILDETEEQTEKLENIESNTAKISSTLEKIMGEASNADGAKKLNYVEQMKELTDELKKLREDLKNRNFKDSDKKSAKPSTLGIIETELERAKEYTDDQNTDNSAGRSGIRRRRRRIGAGSSGLAKYWRLFGLGAGESNDLLPDELDVVDNPNVNSIGEDEATTDQYGNATINYGSTEAKEKMTTKQLIKNSIIELPESVNTVVGLLNDIKSGLLGSTVGGAVAGGVAAATANGGGLLEKLGSGLGAGISAIGTAILGTKAGKWISNAFGIKTAGFKSLLGAIAVPAGAAYVGYNIADHKYDEVANEVGLAGRTWQSMGADSNASFTGAIAMDANGNMQAIAKDTNGNFIRDENGNYVSTNGEILDNSTIEFTESMSTDNLGTRFKKQIGYGFGKKVVGKVAGKVYGKDVGKVAGKAVRAMENRGWITKGTSEIVQQRATSAAERGISRTVGNGSVFNRSVQKIDKISGNLFTKRAQKQAAKKAAKLGQDVGEAVGAVGERAGLISKMTNTIKKVLDKIIGFVKKSKFGKQCGNALNKFKDKFFKLFEKQTAKAGMSALKQGAKAAASVLKTILKTVLFVLVIWDFEEGYNNAAVTWRVLEPTIGERIGSGIIHAIMNYIPFISIFIPDSMIVDLWAEFILPAFGGGQDLAIRRKEAEDALNKHNRENNTNYSWEEFCKQVLEEYTWGEKIGNGIKKGWNNLKEGAKNLWDKGQDFGWKVRNSWDNFWGISNDEQSKEAAQGSGLRRFGIGAGASNIREKLNTTVFKKPIRQGFQPVFAGVGAGATSDPNSTSLLTSLSSKNMEALQDIKTASQYGIAGISAGTLSVLDTIKNIMLNIESGMAANLAVNGGSEVLQNSESKTSTKFGTLVRGFASKALNIVSNGTGGILSYLYKKITGQDDEQQSTAAGASGMVSQLDPRYSGMSMGGRSVGDMGCGPASAVNALNALGKRTSMSSAVSLASNYQTTGGTDLSYFADEFGRNGVGSSYVSGSSMLNAVASGTPTVLMGRDPSNTSKSRSPFGPNNHYVVANGIDSNGNINISDPESNRVRKYSPSILKSVSAGVAASGSGMSRKTNRAIRRSNNRKNNRLLRRFGIGAGAANIADAELEQRANIQNIKRVVWTYLVTEGGMEPFAAAGIMGNMDIESMGINPNSIESDYVNGRTTKYPDKNDIVKTSQSINDYTQNWVFTHKSVSEPNYLANDGYYYCGIGLIQWTGDRCKAFLDYAKENNCNWNDLKLQLNYLIKVEGQTKAYKKFYDGLNTIARGIRIDPSKADIEKVIEECTKYFAKSVIVTKADIPGRISAANDYYWTFKDASLDIGYDNVGNVGIVPLTGENSEYVNSYNEYSNYNSPDSSSNGNSLMGILSTITSAFSDAFSGSFNGSSNSNGNTSSGYYNSNYESYNTGSYDTSNVEKLNNFPYYNQHAEPWGKEIYTSTNNNSQTISSSGCGPTSMAMVMRSFGGQTDPVKAARWSVANNYRTKNDGTSWGFFTEYPKNFNVTGRELGNNKAAVIDALQKGYPVISSQNPGRFTNNKHFIVLSGIDKNGKIYVNDPNSSSKSHGWDQNEIFPTGKNYWSFSRDGKGSIDNSKLGGASGSGLLFRGSSAGNRILLDNSGRFNIAAGDSDLLNISNSSNSKLLTPTNQTTYITSNSNRSSNNNDLGMTKQTAMMLKVIIQLVSSLVENTSKIGSIYDVVSELCKNSNNAELQNIGNRLNKGGYTPRATTDQKTLDSLNDLRDMVDSILLA